MLLYYLVFFFALVQLNAIFVKTSEESTEEISTTIDYDSEEKEYYSEKLADPYTVVYCEIVCLNMIEHISYNSCVTFVDLTYHSGVIDWNWMIVYEKDNITGILNNEIIDTGVLHGLLRCKNKLFPNASIMVIDFPENGTLKYQRYRRGCVRAYHQIYDPRISANSKDCNDYVNE